MSRLHLALRAASKQFQPVVASIASNTFGVNLFTLCGSPALSVSATITVESGVWIGYNTAGSAVAIRTGTWVAGSTITLINKGYIVGGCVAGDGTTAISLDYALTIDNTYGYIFGGGGAGGYGANSTHGANGGWGGVGQGYSDVDDHRTGPGNGEPGGSYLYWNTLTMEYGGDGANGSPWGEHGQEGGGSSTGEYGGGGGNGGAAIVRNSKTLTWLGGNNGAQVKGTVS